VRGLITAAVLLALAGVILRSTLGRLQKVGADIPVTRVQRGDLDLRVFTTGELRATRTAVLVAPSVAGGTLQVIHLLKTGTPVKAGEVVIQFDPSEQEYNLEQSRSDLLQAEQEITKAKAGLAVGAAQNQAQLLKGKFDVRQAELDVSHSELVSALGARKNLLKLEQARGALAQVEKDIQSSALSNQAALRVEEEKRNKARLAMLQAQENIDNMRMRSPIAGLVEVRQNRGASGGFFLPGMSLPEYREGDRLFPGTPIAQVLDTDQIEIQAKVTEADRANLEPGQPVDLHVDALPGETLGGKVKTVAGAATGDFEAWNTMRKFDIAIQLDRFDARLRPGFTAQLVILGRQVKDVLYLPRQAVFEKEAKPVAYVKRGGRFEAHEIKVKYRNESRVAIEGLEEGVEVALVNPESQGKKPGKTSGPLVGEGGNWRLEARLDQSLVVLSGF
jgi:HlyD family secretion protein